jgi:lipoprotein-anchoring transpeptidase ErfK/SrfK
VLVPAPLAAVLLLAAGCTGGGDDGPLWRQGDGQQGPKATATITAPSADATDVPTGTEISFTTADAVETEVTLTDATGDTVEGELSPDGTRWLPDGQLEYDATYTATVTATGDDGKPATATSTFTTMATPQKQIRVTSFLGDGAVIGVGMPLIVRFDRAIPEQRRADVQRRMIVRSDPPQEGIWHWSSPTEVRYRPRDFWEPGTAVSYKIQTGGLPMGDGWYGRSDLTVDLEIGQALIMEVDNATKQMTVSRDGNVLRTIPVSLGKAKTPSSSGTMVVMEKFEETVFDTSDAPDPENRYVIDIEYAQRLTWSGEFIHAAPWSVADQGRTNVSHGCVNMSTANAKWLFGQTRIGDPIVVKGTERQLQNGNGWTEWNMSWEEYVKGSAIPYEPPAEDPQGGVSPDPDLPASPGA